MIGKTMNLKLSTEEMAGLFGRVIRSKFVGAVLETSIDPPVDESGKVEVVRDYGDNEEGDAYDLTSDDLEISSDSSTSN